MPKRKKKKSSSPGSVRRAKSIIKKHIARLKKEKAKQERALSQTARELKDLKNL